MNKEFETIILDLDGPLLDGRQRHYQCYADSLQALGFQPIAITAYWDLKRAAVDRRRLLQLSHAEAVYDKFFKYWLDQIEEKGYLQLDRLQPQVSEILAAWKNGGVQLILATMRQNVANLYWQLAEYKLLPWFDQVIVVDSTKKKSTAITAVIPELDRTKTLWIGDTELDVQSARELGVKVCALSCGLRNEKFLQNLRPDYLADDLHSFFLFGLDEECRVCQA